MKPTEIIPTSIAELQEALRNVTAERDEARSNERHLAYLLLDSTIEIAEHEHELDRLALIGAYQMLWASIEDSDLRISITNELGSQLKRASEGDGEKTIESKFRDYALDWYDTTTPTE